MVLRVVLRIIRVIIFIIRIVIIRVAESIGSPEAIVINIQILRVELGNLAHKTGISYVSNIRSLTFPFYLWFNIILDWRLLSVYTLSASFSFNLYMSILAYNTISSLFLVEFVSLKSIR